MQESYLSLLKFSIWFIMHKYVHILSKYNAFLENGLSQFIKVLMNVTKARSIELQIGFRTNQSLTLT